MRIPARRASLARLAAAVAALSLLAAPALAQRVAAPIPSAMEPVAPVPVSTSVSASPSAFDVLIHGGRVLDGSGNPWFYADVGIRNGFIVAVGELGDAPAATTIDARGRLVVPGFIDVHSHADDTGDREETLRSSDARRRAAPNLVAQGVTTVIVNQDGRSPWPLPPQAEEMARLGVGPNVGLMVGHGTVRARAMGSDFRRAATAAEVAAMRRLVREGMEAGAFGLSAGLEYVPGRWSTTDELVALAEELAPSRGVYISHERSEGADPMWYWPSRHEPGPPTLLDAVRETIEIGERTGAIVVASHIKAKGAHYWGSGLAAVDLIERARARGVEVYADQYPYDTSGSDGGTVLIPGWALGIDRWGSGDGGAAGRGEPDFPAALRRTLADAEQAAALRRDVAHEIARRGGAEQVVVFEHPDAGFVGRTLAELARARGVDAVDMAVALQLEGDPARPGGGRVRGFSMSELDIEVYARQPWVLTASDAGIALPGDGPVHARYYGTFPRKLRRYALERGVVGVEDAVRSMTSLPAQVLGLGDRGVIREGYRADVAVLDLDRVRDAATFFEPHQYAEGVEHVLVNGVPVVRDGALTWELPGMVLKRPRR